MEDSHNNNIGGTLTRSIMGTLDSTTNGVNTMDMKRKRWPTDKEYFMAKELLMTERTYKKDLDIINTVRIGGLSRNPSKNKTLQKYVTL